MRLLLLVSLALVGCGGAVSVDPTPSPEVGLARLSTTGAHTCFLDDAGTLRCFGENSAGQLGRGTLGGRSATPVIVRGDVRWRAVGAGILGTCAIAEDRSLWCWGGRETMGVVNGGEAQPNPTRIGGDDWEDVAVGVVAVCGRHTSGKLECFLPGGPRVIEGGPAIREVSVNFYGIVALDALGQTYLADPEAPVPSLGYAPDAPRFVHVHQAVFAVHGVDAEGHVLRWTRSLGIESSQNGTRFVEADGAYDLVAVASDGAIWLHTDHHAATPSALALRRLDAVGTGWRDVHQNALGEVCGFQRGKVSCFRIRSNGDVGPVELVP
jgi:hypothetical protein